MIRSMFLRIAANLRRNESAAIGHAHGYARIDRLWRWAPPIMLAIVTSATPAVSVPITFSTADSQFSPGVNNQGWWSATSFNNDGNDNTFTGRAGGDLLNGFFTFDLTGFSLAANETIVGASLSLFTSSVIVSGGTFETLGFFDVSTDAITLNNNSGTSAAIFNDLGSGTSYGLIDVFASDSNSTITASLNSAFIADAIAAQGGFLSVGGSILTLDGTGNEGTFGFSGGVDQFLTLETGSIAVPAPPTMALLGVGLLGLGLIARRRSGRQLAA